MPIGDLLAQINGGQSAASSTSISTPPRTTPIPAKRKPDNDLRGNAFKTHRRVTPPKSGQPSLPISDKPSILQRTAVVNGVKPISVTSAKPAAAKPKPSKPLAIGRPSPKPAPVSTAPRPPPKKGSFAEILARGQRAQAVMGQVGKIQHKKVEKGAIKSKEEVKANTQVKGKSTTGYTGTSNKPLPRNGTNGSKSLKKDIRVGPAPRQKVGAGKRAAEEVPAKVKKEPQATTGYTGTARPKPGIPTKKDVPRGGALLNAPLSRHGSSKHSRYRDDYDEDMDDFIDYDDEEEDIPRYGYASDGSSDMEADVGELDKEEKRAEYLARQEDIKEELLEKSRKAAKEERKRKALEALRAGKRH